MSANYSTLKCILLTVNYIFPENMSQSELKKLRNKQKKQKRKEDEKKANAQQAQQRKEAHNKSQKKGPGEDELDAPQKDELVAEKLERPEKPLEEALKFLVPLQNLAQQDIETHFAAFAIYYRKGKFLYKAHSATFDYYLAFSDIRK